MRQHRYIAPWHRVDFSLDEDSENKNSPALSLHGKPAIYHCISRVIGREFLLGDEEKDQFVKFMRLYESFCGIRILNFCIMTNHFHLLLEVPSPPEDPFPKDPDFLKHISLLHPAHVVKEVEQQLYDFRQSGRETQAQELRDKYLRRMWSLSSYMKALKQRFTQWYNGKHARKGGLWEDRFKSVLVEDGHAARVMSAYIDLNPVRAKMVKTPSDYTWCGWAQAGKSRPKQNKLPREGLRRVMMEVQRGQYSDEKELEKALSWRQVARSYRKLLEQGKESASSPDQADKKMIQKRVRPFSKGMVVGSEEFVEENFKQSRDAFSKKRTSGARPFKKQKKSSLRSLRQV